MRQFLRNFALLTPLVIVSMTVACSDNRSRQTSTTQTTTRVQSQQDTSLVDAEDFGLATVIGLIESNAVKNGEGLEQRINDPSSGVTANRWSSNVPTVAIMARRFCSAYFIAQATSVKYACPVGLSAVIEDR